jgi:hypothetical protein
LRLNKTRFVLWMAVVLGLAVGAPAESQQQSLPPGHPPIGQAGGAHAGKVLAADEHSVTGLVLETMDASSYTYVHVDAGSRAVWAAAPQFKVSVGDRVSVPTDSPMQNYRSDSLGRTFPLVYFAGSISVATASAGVEAGANRSGPHPGRGRAPRAEALSVKGIEKPEGGSTVGEIFDFGKGLAGREVAVRGRVVKYSPRIMGTNWLHLQDGTEGKDGSNDLVVTTDDLVAVGDVVLVRGVVSADRDFGFGYTYDLIVEGAKVNVD